VDAIVVGSGPNGLAAAIVLARAGVKVLVVEGARQVGGGVRTEELTLPGFRHDTCSAIHPLGVASPFLKTLPLERHGVEWIHPGAPLAHPFDDEGAAVLERSIEATGATLGGDAASYRKLMEPLCRNVPELLEEILGPLHAPRHPLVLARFGTKGVLPVNRLARRAFDGERAQGLLAGMAAHSMLPLTRPLTAAIGLTLGVLGHDVGWPMARGGSQAIADAMVAHLRELGGEVETARRVKSLAELGDARAILLDVTPRQFLAMAGDRLPSVYRRRLEGYRYGPGVYKLDWALDAPIPWRAEACTRAGTVHLGATLEEVTASERAVWHGTVADRPYVLVAQQTLFDPTRAPEGKHTAWAYCHVPNGWPGDMTDAIESQVERFAPGFRERVLARSAMGPAEVEAHNPNYVGGDINGGVLDLRQLFTRPVARLTPSATPLPGVFICSSSTPPGGGVHGMCGFHAATAALKHLGLRGA
jgi:phytoene dehydrogenase-like protein